MAHYELSCGTQVAPLKLFVYGVEGIGKSTLAAELPSPVFIDMEGGTNQLPVARLPRPSSWTMLLDEVRAVRDGEVPCSTLVIDTADAAERMCVSHVCASQGKGGIEDFGYGRGYTFAKEEFGKLLDLLTEVTERGRNTCLLGHARLDKFERPDESGAYDRFSPKLIDTKKASVSAMVKEWADMVLFCDYKIYVTTDKSGKAKASGGARVIRTTHNPCWDAKNRFGLPDELPMTLGTLPPELAAAIPDMAAGAQTTQVAGKTPAPTTSATTPAPTPAPTPHPATSPAMAEVDARLSSMEADVARMGEMAAKPKPTTGTDDGGYERPDYPERMSALADLMERSHVTDAELRRAVGQTGNFPETCAATDWEQGFVDYLVAGWDKMLRRIETNRVVPFD